VSEIPSQPAVRATAGTRQDGAASLQDRVRALRLPASSSGGAGWLTWAAWLLCLVLAGTTGWFAYLVYARGPADSAAQAQSDGTTSSADLSTPAATGAAADEGELALASKGYIIAAHVILVSPEVSGRIVKLQAEEGQRVARGDTLAEIENTQYMAERDRAAAVLAQGEHRLAELERGSRPEEIVQARAELAEAETQLAQLRTEYERNRELRRRNVISQQDFENAESSYRAHERRVERLRAAAQLMEIGPREERKQAARAEVEAARAELVKAQWRLDNCIIRAPVSGTILRKNAEEGNIVNPAAFNGSFSLCEMADLSDLEVDLNIQERDIARVFKGQRCRVKAEAYGDRVYEGVVSRLMPIADRSKGAIPVRVKLSVPAEEEGVYLKPEMGVLVSFLKRPAPPGVGTLPPAEPAGKANGTAPAGVPFP
jgi:HlyD family secretion protein